MHWESVRTPWECWMIYRGPGFLTVVFSSSPTPILPPLSRQQVVSLSQSSCVPPIELTGGGGGRSQIIRPRESLAFYKSFNTLWDNRKWKRPSADIKIYKNIPLVLVRIILYIYPTQICTSPPHKANHHEAIVTPPPTPLSLAPA